MPSTKTKVNLFLVGTAKCGTNSVFYGLGGHPMITLCERKEINYFEQHDALSERNLEKYHQSFWSENSSYYLDASDNYASRNFDKRISERIFEYNPYSKILMVVRNPIDRIQSQHWHNYNRGWTQINDINEAVLEENYIRDSKYFENIKPFLEKFGHENVRIVFLEDIINEPSQVFSELSDFLELPAGGFPGAFPRENISGADHWINHKYDKFIFNKFAQFVRRFIPLQMQYLVKKMLISRQQGLPEKPLINTANKKLILEELKNDIKSLEDLTGRDLSNWF